MGSRRRARARSHCIAGRAMLNNRLREERGRSKRLMRPTPAHAGHRKNGRGREVLEWQTLRGAVSRRLSQDGAAGGNSGRFFYIRRATRWPEVIVQIQRRGRAFVRTHRLANMMGDAQKSAGSAALGPLIGLRFASREQSPGPVPTGIFFATCRLHIDDRARDARDHPFLEHLANRSTVSLQRCGFRKF